MNLKPCPFCGGKPKLDDYGELKVINCRTCGVHKDSVLNADVIEAWNRRASPEPLTDEQASELLSVCNFYEQDGWQWVKPKIITKRIREILGAGE